jgi:hypothetical protein
MGSKTELSNYNHPFTPAALKNQAFTVGSKVPSVDLSGGAPAMSQKFQSSFRADGKWDSSIALRYGQTLMRERRTSAADAGGQLGKPATDYATLKANVKNLSAELVKVENSAGSASEVLPTAKKLLAAVNALLSDPKAVVMTKAEDRQRSDESKLLPKYVALKSSLEDSIAKAEQQGGTPVEGTQAVGSAASFKLLSGKTSTAQEAYKKIEQDVNGEYDASAKTPADGARYMKRTAEQVIPAQEKFRDALKEMLNDPMAVAEITNEKPGLLASFRKTLEMATEQIDTFKKQYADFQKQQQPEQRF